MQALTISVDNVRSRSLGEYEADRALVGQSLRAAGALRVFEIGHLRALGISDIDLVACFADDFDWRRPSRSMRFLNRLPTTFLHPPWVIRARDEQHLPALFALSRWCDLETGAQVVPLQTAEQRLLWNVEACASVLAMFRARRSRMSTRSALCLLNGITYNLGLAAQDGIEPAGARRFATAILELRSTWFSLAAQVRERRLIESWSAGSELLGELLRAYAEHIETKLGVRGADAFDLPIPGTRLAYRFAPRLGAGVRAATPLVLDLPLALGSLFRLLSSPEGGLQRWLAPRFHAPGREAPIEAPASFAHAVHSYARTNAVYLEDVLGCSAPLLPLNGGTLAHLKSIQRFSGLRGLARRAALTLTGR